MIQPAIALKNVTKKYYLEKPKTFKNWFLHLFSPFQRLTVIKDFSLTIQKGEFVLILGPNGSGKTTLLKLIAEITYPDKGHILSYGKIVPLLELGAGFNYELTGKENIIINASILGLKRDEIKRVFPKIIKFSGLDNFINIPIKRYSTGMIVRLAFSIAIYSQPNILLLDEVFAVGDKKFREFSLKKLYEFKKKGVTIVYVTHHPSPFKHLADRVVTMT